MKKIKTFFLLVLILLTQAAYAYDFSAVNNDGKTLYYTILSETTCEMATEDIPAEAYSGDIVIPGVVSYNGHSYSVVRLADMSGKTVKSVVLPDQMESFSGFTNCKMLESLTIGKSVSSGVWRMSFSGCPALKSIHVAEGNQTYCSVDGVLYSKDMSKLIRVPANYENQYSFPGSVTEICGNAFEGCHISSIFLPSRIGKIGESGFFGCSALESVDIPEGITMIDVNTFYNCSSLKTVSIPSTVKELVYQSFIGCQSLESVTCYATTPPVIPDNAFNHYCDLYVPKGTKSAYEANDVWRKFNIIEGIPDPYQTDVSDFENVLYIDPLTLLTGSTTTVSVKMKNTAEIQTVGLYMTLPDGVTVNTKSNGQYIISLSTERTDAESHSLSKNLVDGNYRVGILGFEGLPFEDNDGEIFTISVSVSSDLKEGDYPIILSNIELTDTNDVSYKVQSIKSKLTVETSSKINELTLETKGGMIYNISGLPQREMKRGVNIVRSAKGVKKIFVK